MKTIKDYENLKEIIINKTGWKERTIVSAKPALNDSSYKDKFAHFTSELSKLLRLDGGSNMLFSDEGKSKDKICSFQSANGKFITVEIEPSCEKIQLDIFSEKEENEESIKDLLLNFFGARDFQLSLESK